MKKLLLIVLLIVTVCYSKAQIGIRTAAPNSKLDIRGSFATSYRAFTANTTATATDNLLVFTGSANASITLPAAAGCTGRNYLIKNASTTGPTPVLTITTSVAETIDGLAAWILDEANESVSLVSNGTAWQVVTQNLAPVTGIFWNHNGNNVASESTLGTINNYDLSFLTSNTAKMRLTTDGNLGIGTNVFDATNPEKLLVDAGVTTSYNVISGRGTLNNYLQLNVQNRSAGDLASADVVASANNGSELVNYIDMGINSSAFNNTTYPVLNGINNAYLYSTGNDFILGNATANKNLSFFTGGAGTGNEWLRITGAGLVGIDNTSPTEKLQAEGNIRLSGLNRSIFFDASVDPYAGIKNISRAGEVNELMVFSGNDVTGTLGADRIRLASNEIYFATTPASSGINTGDPTSFYEDTTNVPTRMYINQNGNVAIGATRFNAVNPEQLLVNADTTSSYNVISAKANINNYVQLNIQNNSNGGSASADIVATADNGNESTNFVNLGINSDGYTGTGITGGANNAYLFTTGNDFVIGNSTDNKSLIFYTTTGGISTQRMKITNAGLLPAQNNVYSMGNTSNRSTAIWAANGTIQTSDRRLKTNIHALPYGLAEVKRLNPVSYNWIDEKNSGNKIGLIAQEVKKIIPEVVVGNEATETLGMNYAEMVPVLINAIKELKNKVDVLKKKAKDLQLIN